MSYNYMEQIWAIKFQHKPSCILSLKYTFSIYLNHRGYISSVKNMFCSGLPLNLTFTICPSL